jgi:hypothetical protein
MKTADEAMAQRHIVVDVDVLAALSGLAGSVVNALDDPLNLWVVPRRCLAKTTAA